MPIKQAIANAHAEMTRWRQDIHAHPELGFEEKRTSALVAEKLGSWGVEVDCSLAGTGVVGTLKGLGSGTGTIGLRADMDALPITEANSFGHASTLRGAMHACGHDGHTTMLLGAARYLAETRNFAGTVHFIFQPAEEGLGGADRMMAEGLFDKFPCDAVYGLHNWPGLPLGTIGMRRGAMMASMDSVTITVTGKGGHAGIPHLAIDPVVVAAHIITALQSLVSRSTDPNEAAVVSITCLEAGTAHNIIPNSVRMTGTVRSLAPGVRDDLEAGIKRVSQSVAKAFGATAAVDYQRRFAALVNTEREIGVAAAAAASVVGENNVRTDIQPTMGSEDFASMLQAKPGTYVFLGQAGSKSIHHPQYDFNDELLPIGAAFWVALVETELPREG